MVTATLTRPHAMSPTMSCDRKVFLHEYIDISRLEPPKARTLTLEPVPKRRAKNSSRKGVQSSDKSRNSMSVQQDNDPPRQSDTSSSPSSRPNSQAPASPRPSESDLSFASRRSSNQAASQTASQAASQTASQTDSEQQGSPGSTPTPSDVAKGSTSRISLVQDKTITVKIEPQAGGCLQGDQIPVKINISHTKPVRSVYGVILTLFRQARVDMRPTIPLGPIEKGTKGNYEDTYPRSLTGLSGLSLSGAGSNHVFRKDLYQSLTPLIIDKHNLTAEINARVSVPGEAFPTISTVPGAMISFKYYVEVVVDIQGKLAGQEKSANNLSGQAAPQGHFINSDVSDMERSAFTPFGSTIIDTTSVRRDKGVVTFTFEVVVGTKDTDRKKGKQKMLDAHSEIKRPVDVQQTQFQSPDRYPATDSGYDWYGANGYDDQWHAEHPYWYDSAEQHDAMYYEYNYDQPPPLPPVPIPQMPDENQMTEKERIRQAETRLLPSEPPGAENGQADSTTGATAPFLPGESSNGIVPESLPTLPEYRTVASSSAAQVKPAREDSEGEANGMSNAHHSAPAASSSLRATTTHNDDKQELQRQQLLVEASYPPTDDVQQDDADEPYSATAHQPSAPTLDEIVEASQDADDNHLGGANESLQLPRYEQ